MRIVVIGGSGLIGSRLVARLAAQGDDVVAASPNTGVDTLTGEGLPEVLTGTQAVVDVSNSPSMADDDVLHFFRTSTETLLATERAADVRHHVALSIVGADRMMGSGYMRAKVAQEDLVRAGGVPWTGPPSDPLLRIPRRHRRGRHRRGHRSAHRRPRAAGGG